MSWLRTLLRLLKNEFFPSATKGLVSVIQFALAIVTAIGFFTGLLEISSKLRLVGDELFLTYLWTTFVCSVVLLGTCLVLLQRLLRSHEDAARAAGFRDRAMLVQHRMAEAVRLAAAQGNTFDVSHGLNVVLGSELREYLKTRLGNHEINCTVKCISPSSEVGYRLTDVFRDSDQNSKTRPRGSEDTEPNFIYSRFRQAGIADSKQIYIPDVDGAQVYGVLCERAHARGYRSILAFPLNRPALPGMVEGAGLSVLVGFLGLDSPDPHAFDQLFKFSRKKDHPAGSGSVEGVYNPLNELHLLYGVADAVATVVMLSQSPPANGN